MQGKKSKTNGVLVRDNTIDDINSNEMLKDEVEITTASTTEYPLYVLERMLIHVDLLYGMSQGSPNIDELISEIAEIRSTLDTFAGIFGIDERDVSNTQYAIEKFKGKFEGANIVTRKQKTDDKVVH